MTDSERHEGDRNARRRRRDRLTARALRERWAIPQAMRRALMERLCEIVKDTDVAPREVISAARAVFSASKINLANISASIKAETHEDLERRMTKIEQAIEAKKRGWSGPHLGSQGSPHIGPR